MRVIDMGMKDGLKPLLLSPGDGVSDLSAAKETDLLFAKEGEGKPFRSALWIRPGIRYHLRFDSGY